MARDDWATPRSALLKSAQRWFGRLIGLIVPLHAKLALATNGRISPSLFWRPGIILETKGRKSGLPRRAVITYLADHDRIVLVASNYGRPGNPSWYENLVANPQVHVIRHGSHVVSRARCDRDERRNLLKRMMTSRMRVRRLFRKTEREIPVVVLTPAHE